MKAKTALLSVFLIFSLSMFAQSITLNISGIENTEGILQIAIFENAQQFEDEKPMKVINLPKTNIQNGSTSTTIELAAGTYAITVLDDEDKSGDMTYRFGVYPLEGVGFSDYMLKGLSKPDFTDFDFTLTNDNAKTVSVQMKYF